MFYSLVDVTEPICKEICQKKSQYLIYGTIGIEPKIKENNPKFLNTKLKEAKKLAKSNPDVDPYKLVYSLLPDEAAKAPMHVSNISTVITAIPTKPVLLLTVWEL